MVVDKIKTFSFMVAVLKLSCPWPKIIKHMGLVTQSVPVPSEHPDKLADW